MVVIASVNVNGIRAAVRERSVDNKGFLHWLVNTRADIVCLQEVRADSHQALEALAPAIDAGWFLAHADSAVKGRSGVAILSRGKKPQSVQIGFPDDLVGAAEFHVSGRYIEAVFGNTRISSVYLPAGEVGTARQEEKERFTDLLLRYMHDPDHAGRHIICGDWNIAHTQRDIKNAKGNMTKAGFLPSERAWFDAVLSCHSSLQWVDVIRSLYPDQNGPYTWWSPRGRAFENNIGWRIDYHIITADLADNVRTGWVEKALQYELRWSDHAPVLVDYDIAF